MKCQALNVNSTIDVTGYFDDSSMLRVVHRERVVALSGPRALLMQATHPVAFQGFFAHTGALDDPYARLERTAQVMDTIGFGSRREADRATRRVRAMHARVRGELRADAGRFPAGTPYAADDPDLLFWVLAPLVDSAVLVFERYVRRLSAAEKEAYWQDYKVIGELFGIPFEHMPGSYEDFRAYMRTMLRAGDLFVSEQARELAVEIVLRPPVPLWARGLLELVNQITIGLLPREVRRLYGFRWDPLRGLATQGHAEYLKRVVLPVLPRGVRLVPSARS